MAIQISGNTVIDDSRNITCIGIASATSLGGDWIATQAEAEAGTNNDQLMTPLRVSQAISALAGGGMVDSDIDWSTCAVGCAVRGGGNVIYKSGGIIWIVAPFATEVTANNSWPMGYCNGQEGAAPRLATACTGRSGWFLPDLGMLQTAYSCKVYYDTYAGPGASSRYWSSSERNLTHTCTICFITGAGLCYAKCATGYRQRAMRVVCY